ncbi:uncharacterized protein LOC143028519 isoform X2 [Oratosquilla oratoria]|uniref:uncharacterized protein LOC143028519 isoform X2 n=1 Tax=Oratosquilla oratoria TaxID=337810 RepID=UPI003F77398E
MGTPLLPETVQYIAKEKLLTKIFLALQNLVEEESSFSAKKVKGLFGICSSNEAKYSAIVSCQPPQESRNSLKGMFKDVEDGNDLYLIHIWQISEIHEIIEGSSNSVLDSIVSENPYISLYRKQKLDYEVSHELIDLRIKHIHRNGVVFTVNQENWNDKVKEISTSIAKLRVKKMLNHEPTPGSTYAFHIHPSLVQTWKLSPEVVFVRLRVVKVTGDSVHAFAMDIGQVMTCLWRTLQLLPAQLICIPPCGRLARLPITFLAGNCQVKAVYALLLSLVHHVDTIEDIDLSVVHHWIKDTSLMQHTLHLLLALSRKVNDHSILKQISSIIAGYLQEEVLRKNVDILNVQMAIQVIKEVIEIWDGIRITIAKGGGFIALCELAHQIEMEEVWETIGTVLWGRRDDASWRKNRCRRTIEIGSVEWKGCSCKAKSTCASIKQGQYYSGHHTVAMEKRQQVASLPKQLVRPNSHRICHSQHHWQYHEEWLRQGCIITIEKNLNHYIFHEKNVNNFKMDILLQITLGILNAGNGGKIYIGLTSDRVVEGIKMSRIQRDCFKLSFSKLLTEQVKPSIQPCDFFIKYTPVKKQMELDTTAKESLFLITITLQRGIGIIHYADPTLIYKYEHGVPLLQRGSALNHLLKENEKWEAQQEADVAMERTMFLQAFKKN